MAVSPTVGNAYGISPEGQELVQHGTPLFPVAFYNDDLERNTVPWHWHDEMEAVYIESGSTIVSVGWRHFTLTKGQGFFINAAALHAAAGRGGTHCRYHSIVFHPRLVGGGVDSVFWQKYLKPLIGSGVRIVVLDGSQPWHEDALNAIEQAWQAGVNETEGFEFRVRARLSELIYRLTLSLPASAQPLSEKALRDSKRIRLMLKYIEDHYADEITVSDIARSALISESECLRCFRDTIGRPPIQYVKQYRVQKAAELLTSTALKIGQIAERCGFQDDTYFIRSFREIKGMTPAKYRAAY